MEEFLKRMERDIEHKIMSCVKGETIVKPFSQVYDKVRGEATLEVIVGKKKKSPSSIKSLIYADGEHSIYQKALARFLLENPEFLSEIDLGKN